MIGTFRPDRIRSIADRFGVDGNMALENILYGLGLLSSNPSWKQMDYIYLSCCLPQHAPLTANIRYAPLLTIFDILANQSINFAAGTNQ